MFQPDRIDAPLLRQLYEYWRSKCDHKRIPSRPDIDPSDIPSVLPVVYLIDVERNPLRFRFRLVGTYAGEWFGPNATGAYLDELLRGDPDGQMRRAFGQVVQSRVPRYDHCTKRRFGRISEYYDRLVLPLTNDDGKVNMLLCGLYVLPWEEQLALAN